MNSLLRWFGSPPVHALGALLLAVTAGILTQLFRYWLDRRRERREKERLENRMALDPHTPDIIKRAADGDIYIRPGCQENDPATGQEAVGRRSLFARIDELLVHPPRTRCVFLLADSGMGKSAFLVHYYRYHWGERSLTQRHELHLVVIPLSAPNADSLIEDIRPQQRSNTVLFLDALDEDAAATKDYPARLAALMSLVRHFHVVLISCRTQFVTSERPFPTAVSFAAPSGPIGLDGGPDPAVLTIYLSPLSQDEVRKYLAVRYPLLRHPRMRRRARNTVRRFADLIARPLLLTYIEDLDSATELPRYSFQVYEIIVEHWLEREYRKGFLTTSKENLRAFCQQLAGDLFCNRSQRISTQQLNRLAQAHSVRPDPGEIRERALLNRDAEDHWKFAHRSIMEYLLVKDCSMAEDPPRWIGPEWTLQMRTFAREMLLAGDCKGLPGADLRGEDFRGLDLRGLNLRGVSLAGALLDGADLRGADLRETDGLSVQLASLAKSDHMTRWPVVTLEGHTAAVLSVAVSPSGDFIVSSSRDTTVRVWETSTRALRFVLAEHTRSVGAIAISPHGDFIVSGSEDSTVRVWDALTGTPRFTLEGHTQPVRAVAVSPQGDFIVSGSDDNTVRVWNAQTGSLRLALDGHTAFVPAIAVSPNGDFIASRLNDNTVRLWDARTGALRLSFAAGKHSWLHPAVAVSPLGNFIVSGRDNATIGVWDTRTGALRFTLEHAGCVRAIAVSAREDFIVSVADDRNVRVWDARTGVLRFTLAAEGYYAPGHARTIALSPRGDFIVCGSHDMRVWDARTGELRCTFTSDKRYAMFVHAVAVSPKGDFIVSGSDCHRVRMFFPPATG